MHVVRVRPDLHGLHRYAAPPSWREAWVTWADLSVAQATKWLFAQGIETLRVDMALPHWLRPDVAS